MLPIMPSAGSLVGRHHHKYRHVSMSPVATSLNTSSTPSPAIPILRQYYASRYCHAVTLRWSLLLRRLPSPFFITTYAVCYSGIPITDHRHTSNNNSQYRTSVNNINTITIMPVTGHQSLLSFHGSFTSISARHSLRSMSRQPLISRQVSHTGLPSPSRHHCNQY